MIDLSLVAMEDLTLELKKRLDNLVIVGEKALSEGEGELFKFISGDPIKCLGLMEVIKPDVMPDKLNTNYEG